VITHIMGLPSCVKCFDGATPHPQSPRSLLREYFEVEFGLVGQLPWAPGGLVDVERVVDDFVLFCMLVGNDFLPGAARAARARHPGRGREGLWVVAGADGCSARGRS
jgi:hypothetical protein